MLAPSERAVVHVLFDAPGELALEHHTPERTYTLAPITVSDERAEPSLAEAFATAAARSGARGGARAHRSVHGRRARQDAGVRGRDGVRGARGPGRLRVPDASGRRQRGAGPLPDVRDDAAGDRRAADRVRVPDAPGRDCADARQVPAVRDEAARRVARDRGDRRPPRARRPRASTTSTRRCTRATRRMAATGTITLPRAGSSGKTTWSRSTGSRRRPTPAGS